MGFDDLDDLLHGDDELEAAFRELDAQIKLDELRRSGPARKNAGGARKASGRAKATRATSKAPHDPLADLKAAFDGKAAPNKKKTTSKPKAAAKKPRATSKAKGSVQRYLVVVCPSCGGKNRVPLERLRKSLPVCGRCKTDLSFERS
ncbi:MAG: hypothetical protein ACPGU1_02630 [Myxococcota bacterium]